MGGCTKGAAEYKQGEGVGMAGDWQAEGAAAQRVCVCVYLQSFECSILPILTFLFALFHESLKK